MAAGAHAVTHPPRWKTLGAFATICFVWGSTFLAIRIGVHDVPPFLLAAMRFLVAGLAMFGWAIARGERSPTRREWASVFVVALLIFVFDYGLLFWAEQRVPSGLAAVMMATIPAFTAVAEVVLLRTQQMTARLAVALLIGLAGVGVLVSPTLNLGGAPIDTAGAIALVIASMSWSLGSVLNRKLPLPAPRPLNSGAQMLAGGVLLSVAAATLGEYHSFNPSNVSIGSWLALLYLIVAGSIVAFTAWLWLIHHESPTKVGTYTYVNPVVAVVIGYFLGNEEIGLRTAVGTLLVLCSVILITVRRGR